MAIKKTKRLWDVLDSKENSFSINFPKFLEKEYALGTMVTVEYKKNGRTIIDYIEGDVVLPYKYTNSYINGLITVSRSTEGTGKNKMFYTLLTYHEYKEGDDNNPSQYLKTNELYESKNEKYVREIN